MSATTTSESFPPASTTSAPDDDNMSDDSGLNTATYYGAIALAVFVIASVTIVSRILYTRRRLAQARQRAADERADLRRMHGDAAEDLPTYREAQLMPRAYPPRMYNYYGAPPNHPNPSSGHPSTTTTTTSPTQAASGFVSRVASRLHVRLPSLPKALHLRSRPDDLPASHDTHPSSYYSREAPPKYDDINPSRPSNSDSPPQAHESVSSPDQLDTSQTNGNPNHLTLAHPLDEPDEEFIHPEERRRREQENNNDTSSNSNATSGHIV